PRNNWLRKDQPQADCGHEFECLCWLSQAVSPPTCVWRGCADRQTLLQPWLPDCANAPPSLRQSASMQAARSAQNASAKVLPDRWPNLRPATADKPDRNCCADGGR